MFFNNYINSGQYTYETCIMNDTMIIKETTVWGDHYKARNTNTIKRLMKKQQILNHHPFIDHYKKYAYKPKSQRGPAKEEQTFIISYAYNYDKFADESTFINVLSEIGLLFYKEKCLFRGHDAYKIIIYDSLCPIDEIKTHSHAEDI